MKISGLDLNDENILAIKFELDSKCIEIYTKDEGIIIAEYESIVIRDIALRNTINLHASNIIEESN